MNSADVAVQPTVLDNRRIPCAIGLIRAEAAMAQLDAGSVLEIRTRDRFAPMEIPLWAQRGGHGEPIVHRVGLWPARYWTFWVEAGAGEAGAGSSS
ncbi:MAG TPA: sulfurtransferase TusA family protein [Terrimesophilobacter sp.]|nr:sulfurtransferase TusA family protein [Terrimesophilobacter sp.]HRQ00283.1 sulfurtransferase TusA family protein [Terrimesophilobacter sp.]